MRYIDADAFAEKMKRQYCESCDNYQGIRCNSCHCGDWLDDLSFEPTADVRENVKGEWIQDEIAEALGVYLCSNCNIPTQIVDKSGNTHLTPFCPNCGADMRGEA